MTTQKLFEMGYRFESGGGKCLAIPGQAARYYNNYTTVYRYDPTIWKWVAVGQFPLFDC